MYSVDRENFALPTYPSIFQGALTGCSSDEFSFKASLGTLGNRAPAAFHKDVLIVSVGSNSPWKLAWLRVWSADHARNTIDTPMLLQFLLLQASFSTTTSVLCAVVHSTEEFSKGWEIRVDSGLTIEPWLKASK